MKKLNKNGMTLIELLVSVVLISVIMIFMYKLISDVRNDKKENDKFTDNLIKISEIEVEIQNLIVKENISTISLSDRSVEFPNLKVEFGEDSDGNLLVTLDKNNDGFSDKKWTLENLSLDGHIYCYEDKVDEYHLINLKIYLKNNNKIIHVIEIPYYSSALTKLNPGSWDTCPN